MRSVRTLYTAMMVLLAKATDRELARMVSYLKEENRILRARLAVRRRPAIAASRLTELYAF